MELKKLTIEELRELAARISVEIKNRSTDLVLWEHDCKGSSNHHMKKYTHWAKLLTGVDTTKTDGYAYLGDWLRVNEEVKIPNNSIVVEFCSSNGLTAYRITEGGAELIGKASRSSQSELIETLSKLF